MAAGADPAGPPRGDRRPLDSPLSQKAEQRVEFPTPETAHAPLRWLPTLVAMLAPALHAQAPTPRPPVPGAPAGVLAFVDVAVIPMDTERVLAGHTVLVQQGWITALGPKSQVKIPANAVRIDGRNKYLIPGLSDCHVHLAGLGLMPIDRDTAKTQRKLIAYVANGATTIRNMDFAPGSHGEFMLRMRARAAAGEIVSPRIYTAGAWYTYGGPPVASETMPVGEIAQRIAAYKAAGYDHLKSADTDMSPVMFDSLVAAAQRVGLPVVGHIPDSVPLAHVLTSMKSTEHGYGFLPFEMFKKHGPPPAADTLAALAALTRRLGHWLCPTITTSAQSGLSYHRRDLSKAMHKAGVGILLGTDEKPVVEELQAMVEDAGFTPYEALLTGTRNLAQYYNTLDSTGTVAVGKRADLLLVNADPLAKAEHAANLAGVLLGGRWLPRAELARMYWERIVTEALNQVLPGLAHVQLGDQPMARDSAVRWAVATLRDSLGALPWVRDAHRVVNTPEAYRRALGFIAQWLGHARTALTPAQQAAFDPRAVAWVSDEFWNIHPRATIPGVQIGPRGGILVRNGRVGASTVIDIRVYDAFGNWVRGVSPKLEITISGANGPTKLAVREFPGGYEASYTPTKAGTDLVTLTLDGAVFGTASTTVGAGRP